MKDFKYTLAIKEAEPEEVYNALTNPFAIELWSGYPATMELKIGSEFSMWEGDITGKIIDFKKDSKVVQEWFFEDTKQASIATINIFPKSGNRSYIVLTHTNIPDEDYENITEGWKEYYLGAIQKFFEEE